MKHCEIVPLAKAHRRSAIEVMASAFTKDDPLAMSQGIDSVSFSKLIDGLFNTFQSANLSYVAVDTESDRIAALVLVDTNITESGDEGSDAIAEIIRHARHQYFNRYSAPAGETLHIHFVASDPGYRRQRLVSGVTDVCLKNAREQGYRLAIVEASGIRSRRLFKQHHGFTERVQIDYETFVRNGEYPFAEIAEHGGLTLMDKWL